MPTIIVSAGHNEYSIRQIAGITTRDLWDPADERTDDGAFRAMLRERGLPDDVVDWDLGFETIVEITYESRRHLHYCLVNLLEDLAEDPGGDDGTFDYWPSGMRLALQLNAALGGDGTEAIKETAKRVIYGMGRDDFASELYYKIGLPDPKHRERGEEIGIRTKQYPHLAFLEDRCLLAIPDERLSSVNGALATLESGVKFLRELGTPWRDIRYAVESICEEIGEDG